MCEVGGTVLMCLSFLIFRTGTALKELLVLVVRTRKNIKLMSNVAIIEILSLILILGFSYL